MKNTKTNTEITNVNNNTNKEETKMKNTAKRNNKITCKIAAMLAAVMAMTTMASIGASAATDVDAVVHMNSNVTMNIEAEGEEKPVQYKNGKFILNDDMNLVKDIGAKTIFKILDDIPYTKYLTPALECLLDSFVGTEDPTMQQLDEINGKIDCLFNRIDKMQTSIENLVRNELRMDSFYSAYISFKADTEYIANTINETLEDEELSNVDKLAKIGSLAGKLKDWQSNFGKSQAVLNNYIASTSLGGSSIFEVIYDNTCSTVMFSKEAVEKSRPICEAILQTYTAGSTAIIECLSAQIYVNSLSEDMRAQIDRKYLDDINASNNELINKIRDVSAHLTGENDTSVTYSKLYEDTFSSKKMSTLVDKGNCNIDLTWDLSVTNFKNIPNVNDSSRNCQIRAQQQADWFNNNVVCNQIDGKYVRDIAAYAASKGITIRQLLNANGFNTDAIPENTYIISDTAYVNVISDNCFCDKSDAVFKGLNIDAKINIDKNGQVVEDTAKFWKVGMEGCMYWNKWNSNHNGNACIFQVMA